MAWKFPVGLSLGGPTHAPPWTAWKIERLSDTPLFSGPQFRPLDVSVWG